MAKVIGFMLILGVIILLLNLAGYTTSSGYILDVMTGIESSGNPASSSLWTLIYGAIATLIAVSAITATLFGRAPLESIAAAGLGATLALFFGDFMTILNVMNAECSAGSWCRWAYYIVYIVFVPLLLAYMVSIFEWITGDH